MDVPSRKESEEFIFEAQELNPGPWVQHSLWAARAAESIASYHPRLDPDVAFVMGYLHDIGRREGLTQIKHILDGFNFLQSKGFEDAARICLTHSFPVQDIAYRWGKWDGTEGEYEFVQNYISGVEYTEYDRLIQLCDALALPTGYCLIEKRMVDVVMRYGVNQHTVPKWKAYFGIQREIEEVIGQSVYKVLPGVVENTFGFAC